MPIYDWFDSDDEINLPGCESEPGFDQVNKEGNLEIESESESGSDEFDVSGYYVGKKIRSRVYEFSDSSVPFSGFGIILKETESDSSSYDSDVTSKPSCFGDELNDVESRFISYDCIAVGSKRERSNGPQKRKVFAVRDFPKGCGVGTANLIDENSAQEVSAKRDFPVGGRSTVPSIKRRSVSAKRDFPIGCGTSVPSLPCIEKRNVSAKRDSPAGCGSIVSSSIKRRCVWAKRDFPIGCGVGSTTGCPVS